MITDEERQDLVPGGAAQPQDPLDGVAPQAAHGGGCGRAAVAVVAAVAAVVDAGVGHDVRSGGRGPRRRPRGRPPRASGCGGAGGGRRGRRPRAGRGPGPSTASTSRPTTTVVGPVAVGAHVHRRRGRPDQGGHAGRVVELHRRARRDRRGAGRPSGPPTCGLALVDDDHGVGDPLDLVEQVAREHDVEPELVADAADERQHLRRAGPGRGRWWARRGAPARGRGRWPGPASPAGAGRWTWCRSGRNRSSPRPTSYRASLARAVASRRGRPWISAMWRTKSWAATSGGRAWCSGA